MCKITYLLPMLALCSCFRFDPAENIQLRHLQAEKKELSEKLDVEQERVNELAERLKSQGPSDDFVQQLKDKRQKISFLADELRQKDIEINQLWDKLKQQAQAQENFIEIALERDELKEQLSRNNNELKTGIDKRQSLSLELQEALSNLETANKAKELVSSKLSEKDRELKRAQENAFDLNEKTRKLAEEKFNLEEQIRQSKERPNKDEELMNELQAMEKLILEAQQKIEKLTKERDGHLNTIDTIKREYFINRLSLANDIINLKKENKSIKEYSQKMEELNKKLADRDEIIE